MNLFWARAENVTPALRFESSHRFKILRLRKMATAWVGDRQVVFGGSRDESFSLRETRHDVSLSTFAAPTALETSAGLRIGADVQIGGGVRVGDAFQVISGVKSIAIMGNGVLCRNFSGGARVSLASNKRNKRRPAEHTESEAGERGRG